MWYSDQEVSPLLNSIKLKTAKFWKLLNSVITISYATMKVLVIKSMPGQMSFTPFNNFPFNFYSDTLRCIKNGLYCGQEEWAKYIRKVGTFSSPIPFNTTLNRKETYFAATQLTPDFLRATVFFLLGTILTTSLESCMNTKRKDTKNHRKDRSYSCDFQIQLCNHVWPLPHNSSLGGRTMHSDS